MAATCRACGRDMQEADSCALEEFVRDGVAYRRIPFASPEWAADLRGNRCNDCGVMEGWFHHPTCDMEECPLCHVQLIACGCFAPLLTP